MSCLLPEIIHSYSPSFESNVPFCRDRRRSVKRGPSSRSFTFSEDLNSYLKNKSAVSTLWTYTVGIRILRYSGIQIVIMSDHQIDQISEIVGYFFSPAFKWHLNTGPKNVLNIWSKMSRFQTKGQAITSLFYYSNTRLRFSVFFIKSSFKVKFSHLFWSSKLASKCNLNFFIKWFTIFGFFFYFKSKLWLTNVWPFKMILRNLKSKWPPRAFIKC